MSDDYSDNANGRSWLERVGQFFTSTPDPGKNCWA